MLIDILQSKISNKIGVYIVLYIVNKFNFVIIWGLGLKGKLSQVLELNKFRNFFDQPCHTLPC